MILLTAAVLVVPLVTYLLQLARVPAAAAVTGGLAALVPPVTAGLRSFTTWTQERLRQVDAAQAEVRIRLAAPLKAALDYRRRLGLLATVRADLLKLVLRVLEAVHLLQPTAQDYVEKIFQLPLWVQPVKPAERTRIVTGLLSGSVRASGGADQRPRGEVHVGPEQESAVATMLARGDRAPARGQPARADRGRTGVHRQPGADPGRHAPPDQALRQHRPAPAVRAPGPAGTTAAGSTWRPAPWVTGWSWCAASASTRRNAERRPGPPPATSVPAGYAAGAGSERRRL